METTNTLLGDDEKSLLSNMVGKTLNSLTCDAFDVKPVSHMSVWIRVADDVFEIRNELEEIHYLGEEEELGVISIRRSDASQVHSHLVGHKLQTIELNRPIVDIVLYEDTHVCSENGNDAYKYSFTSAIIFVLEGTELAVEKDIPYDENMTIYRGPGARKNVYAPEEMLAESDSPKYAHRAVRAIVSLKEWAS